VQTSDLAPACTSQPGVYVAGAFQAPKVIQRSVTEASNAAEAATALIQSRGALTRRKTYPAERRVAGDETRIGVFVCSCGINIAGVINVDDWQEGRRHCERNDPHRLPGVTGFSGDRGPGLGRL
jgi:heterodisulfide reductase subunit A